MNSTRKNKSTSRSTYLPNISMPTVQSYAQHFEHMTKIANYNEMNEMQIWKEYQKLRMALKQLNEEVLRHMEKKAQNALYAKEGKKDPDLEVTLDLLEGEKRSNETRLQIFLNEKNSLEQRVDNLTNRKDYLLDMKNEIQICQSKIKQLNFENKELKKRQIMASKDLINSASLLQKLLFEEQLLHLARKKFNKFENSYKDSVRKIHDFTEKSDQFQNTLEKRVDQFRGQEDYIAEEENLQRFEDLQNQKTQLSKYESIYKRNYLIKLKQLENLVNSINKHDQIIQETSSNILNMRGQIDTISATVNISRKKNSVSMMQEHKRRPSHSGRRSIVLDNSVETQQNDKSLPHQLNDKNSPLS